MLQNTEERTTSYGCGTQESVTRVHYLRPKRTTIRNMKYVIPIRVLLLNCCLLVVVRSSVAQAGLLAATTGTSQTSAPMGQATPGGPKPEPITLPAGTRLLMKLVSPLHSTSSTPGSGVYLETMFPLVHDDRVAIPEHTRVIGTVIDENRPGRVRGRAQMRIRFIQLILPDNQVVPIAAGLQSLPGSGRNRTVDHEGTIEPVDQIDADVYTVATTTGAGVLAGSISHTGIGVGRGALIGGGLGLAKVLFTRGDEISLPVGTGVEMVLQHPLTVQPTFFATTAANGDSQEGEPQPSATTAKERNSQGRAEKMPCLRDGVTLRCVAATILAPGPAHPDPPR